MTLEQEQFLNDYRLLCLKHCMIVDTLGFEFGRAVIVPIKNEPTMPELAEHIKGLVDVQKDYEDNK